MYSSPIIPGAHGCRAASSMQARRAPSARPIAEHRPLASDSARPAGDHRLGGTVGVEPGFSLHRLLGQQAGVPGFAAEDTGAYCDPAAGVAQLLRLLLKISRR